MTTRFLKATLLFLILLIVETLSTRDALAANEPAANEPASPPSNAAPASPPSNPAQPSDAHVTPNAPAPFVHETRLFLEPAFIVPIGDLADATSAGVGALLGIDYALSPVFRVSARAGYLAGTEATRDIGSVTLTSSIGVAPILGGIRCYIVDGEIVRLYLLGEAGAMVVNGESATRGEIGGASIDASASKQEVYFGTGLNAGLDFDGADLRVGLLTIDLAHAGSSTAATVSLALRFASF